MKPQAFVTTVAAAAVSLSVSSIAAAAKRPAGSDRPPSVSREEEPPEHFRIGPIVGVGFPRPFAVEGFAKIEKLVGLGFEYSFLPRMNMSNVEAGFTALAADLRIFPFRGAFFLGARAGRQWLDAKATLTAGRLGSVSESMTATTWFINPRAGFLFTFRSGITIGIDAGVQVPISPSYERSGATEQLALNADTGLEESLASVANALGNRTTPTVDLLRLGFLF